MKFQKILLLVSLCFFVSSAGVVAAGDFDWMRDLNIRAETDLSGFRASLATRFQIGDTQIEAVLGNVEKPADAYMVFRLAEISARPMGYVLERYRLQRDKGWGALAKSLGIKPGSPEFHALKRGEAIYNYSYTSKGKGKSKGKGRGKDKGRGGR